MKKGMKFRCELHALSQGFFHDVAADESRRTRY